MVTTFDYDRLCGWTLGHAIDDMADLFVRDTCRHSQSGGGMYGAEVGVVAICFLQVTVVMAFGMFHAG